MIRLLSDAANAHANGAEWTSWLHKTSAPAPGAAGLWADLSMGAGTPKYNAWAGTQYEFTPLVNGNNSAIYCGPAPAAGQTKHLTSLGIQSTQASNNVPLTFLLCDYLGHYPLVDGDSTDLQEFDNTQPLPRYADGAGVRCFAVVTAPMAAAANVTITYTNSDGVPGRVASASVVGLGVLGAIASCGEPNAANSKIGPWFPLAGNDGGIRSIESVQFASGAGGFLSLVLARPLEMLVCREANTWTEKYTPLMGPSMPRIENGAFLNYLFCTSGTGNPATVRGNLTFAWG